MESEISFSGIVAQVVLKDIKNVHLSVYPPSGLVRISAPQHMSLDIVRAYAISKTGWIKSQQRKLQSQERTTPRLYIDGESHYVWGRRYLLKVIESTEPASVKIKGSRLILQIRPGSDQTAREHVLEEWMRSQLKSSVPSLIQKWEKKLGVQVQKFYVQRMKTKWGSCTPARSAIRLNSELAKKPIECLEYIVVHEMVHLLEASHNSRFIALMDHHMPKWRYFKEELNRLPVRHEHWKY